MNKITPHQHPSSDMLIANPVLRTLFKIGALLSVLLAFIGIFLPLLPTTPFLLLAVFFSVRSSAAMHTWLTEHKLFGPPLRQYLDEQTISAQSFRRAVTLLWLTIGLSIWLIPVMWVKCLLLVIATGVTVHLGKLRKAGSTL